MRIAPDKIYGKLELSGKSIDNNAEKPISVNNRELTAYFLITFLWSWFFWIFCFFSAIGIKDFSFWFLFIVGAFGPFVASNLLTYKSEGKKGLKKLWKKLLNPKIELKWLFFILLLFPVIMGISLLLSSLIEEFKFNSLFLSQPWLLALEFIAIFLYGGPFNEEFGWRGYALDRLQAERSALTSSVILGIIWACWHFPLFFIVGTSQEGQSFPMFLIMVLLLTILFTFLYNNSGGNLLAAMLFHTMFNWSFKLFNFTLTAYGSLFFGGLLIMIVLLIVIAFGPKTLSKKPLKTLERNQPKN